MIRNVLRRQVVVCSAVLFMFVLAASVPQCVAGEVKGTPPIKGTVSKTDAAKGPANPLPKASFGSWAADNIANSSPAPFSTTFTITGKNLTPGGATFVVKTDKGEICSTNILSETEAKGTMHFPQNKTYNAIQRKCRLYLNDTAVGNEIVISQPGLPK